MKLIQLPDAEQLRSMPAPTGKFRSTVFGAIVAAATVFTGGMATAAEPVIVPLLTCPFGCGVVEGHTIFGNVVAQAKNRLIIAAQETPGYMYNVQEMAKERHWTKSVFGTEDAIIQLAMQGGTPELKEFLPDQIPIKFQMLMGDGYWSQGKFFVTTDPDIKSVADMKGKSISLGLRGQSDWGLFPRLILEHGYGITTENSDIRHMTPGALTQQLIDGTTDVTITGYGTDPKQTAHVFSGPLRKLEASGKKLYYIPVSEEAIAKVNKKFGTTFVTRVIKAGTLPQQTSDLVSGFVRGYKAVHPNFPEDVAYDFVMAAHKHRAEMGKLSKLWTMTTEQMMVDGLTEENTHPGAVRAYKELGIWELRNGSVPVTYPG